MQGTSTDGSMLRRNSAMGAGFRSGDGKDPTTSDDGIFIAHSNLVKAPAEQCWEHRVHPLWTSSLLQQQHQNEDPTETDLTYNTDYFEPDQSATAFVEVKEQDYVAAVKESVAGAVVSIDRLIGRLREVNGTYYSAWGIEPATIDSSSAPLRSVEELTVLLQRVNMSRDDDDDGNADSDHRWENHQTQSSCQKKFLDGSPTTETTATFEDVGVGASTAMQQQKQAPSLTLQELIERLQCVSGCCEASKMTQTLEEQQMSIFDMTRLLHAVNAAADARAGDHTKDSTTVVNAQRYCYCRDDDEMFFLEEDLDSHELYDDSMRRSRRNQATMTRSCEGRRLVCQQQERKGRHRSAAGQQRSLCSRSKHSDHWSNDDKNDGKNMLSFDLAVLSDGGFRLGAADQGSLELELLCGHQHRHHHDDDVVSGFSLDADIRSCSSSVTWCEGSKFEEVSVKTDELFESIFDGGDGSVLSTYT